MTTNNKTLIIDDEIENNEKLQPENFNTSKNNNFSSLSSNKTIILSDELQNEENENYNQKSYDSKALVSPNKDKFFSQYFEFNHSNVLLGHAVPILSFINRIRTLKEYDESIFRTAMELINEYIQKLKKNNIKTEMIQSTSYILCMSIDEVALKCSWSYGTSWINKGVLDTFFQQSQDDGYFLNLIEYYLANQAKNIDILEVFGVCLSICTRGNNSSKTAIKLENFRHKILNALKNHYPLETSHFAPHAVPPDQTKKQISNSIPLWAIGLACFLILIAIYSSFRFALSLTSEPVYNKIIQLYQPGLINSNQDKIK